MIVKDETTPDQLVLVIEPTEQRDPEKRARAGSKLRELAPKEQQNEPLPVPIAKATTLTNARSDRPSTKSAGRISQR